MLKSPIAASFVFGLCITCGGCINMQAYFEPRLPKVQANELPTWKDRRQVTLTVDYKINGVPDPKQARRARSKIAAAIEGTKLFRIRDRGSEGFVLSVAEDFDEKDVYAKAKAAGETFGAAGSISQDKMSFEASFVRSGQTVFSSASNLTMNMILGNRSVPDDYEPMSLMAADRELVNANVRAFIRDAYRSGAFGE